jgi:hypothetical protein
MFDTKKDGRKIVPDEWIQIKDRAQLNEIIAWLEFKPEFRPVIFRILGPKGNPYGYLYAYNPEVLIKATSDDTLWVSDIPLPPIHVDIAPGLP